MAIFKGRNEPQVEDKKEGEGLDDLSRRIDEAGLPDHARKAAIRELKHLEKSDPSVAEYGIGLNYLNFILDLPWRKSTRDRLDLKAAAATLDAEHYGLDVVKERVLDHLAVTIMKQRAQGAILVIDDEQIARENVAHVLRKEGYAVETAASSEEGLELHKFHDFDVVITDLKMKGMDGLELLNTWKDISPQTEFIIITGYASVETAVDALSQGARQYLAKPLNLDRLRATVAEILERRMLSNSSRSPVICFTGPPGTGKTSIGRAIAKALGRTFVRCSMAGLRDEAELRGHRRTYVGAMPGRILSEIRRIGANNPVFMLDEIDKIGQDFRGDPASVLLEILDPEQNSAYQDHYLDIPFDLSGVLFITTANEVERLPRPLQDRMEVVRFSSYSLAEKRGIAERYLFPKQAAAAGLKNGDVAMSHEAMDRVITDYTRESGVRNLERCLGGICRRLVRLVLQEQRVLPVTIEAGDVPEFMGKPRFAQITDTHASVPGVASGLVWSETGGHTISVETAIMRGTGKLTMTGSLGRVLRESAQTALSHIRSQAERFGVDPEFFAGSDIHVHIPAGSIPKDGPSAGVTITVALVSLLSGRQARADTAMTGELTLSGGVLPVSGIREKVLAAQQAGFTRVLLPVANQSDARELDEDVLGAVEPVFVKDAFQAVEEALVSGE